MRPHFSNSINNRQSSRENASPSSGTSPLTSYKEVPARPPPPHPLPAFHLRFAMPALQSDELVFRLVRMNVTNFPPLPSKVGLILAWLLHRSRQGRWGPWQWGQERLSPRASLGLRQATSTKF